MRNHCCYAGVSLLSGLALIGCTGTRTTDVGASSTQLPCIVVHQAYEEVLFEMGVDNADKTMRRVVDAIFASNRYSRLIVDSALLDSDQEWADRNRNHFGVWKLGDHNESECVHLHVALADVNKPKTSGFLGLFKSTDDHATNVVIEILALNGFNGEVLYRDSTNAIYRRYEGVKAGGSPVYHPPQKGKLVGPFARSISKFALDSIPKYLAGETTRSTNERR